MSPSKSPSAGDPAAHQGPDRQPVKDLAKSAAPPPEPRQAAVPQQVSHASRHAQEILQKRPAIPDVLASEALHPRAKQNPRRNRR
jgi:hypothetical protein